MDSEVTRWQVLIVDDDMDSLGVAEQFLAFMGAKVIIAKNGVEAVTAVENQPPTVVLLDLSMPEMDGWEVFRRLRSNPRMSSIPVIALTAPAMKDDEEKVKEAGFDGYITKPYILTSLLEDIKRCLAEFNTNTAMPLTQPGAAPAPSDAPEPTDEAGDSSAVPNIQAR